MSFTIYDLIHQKIFPDTKLVAGHMGCHHEIRWVNLVEILDAPDSIQPEELLFTTGFDFQNEEKFQHLIPLLASHRVSGMVIQLGYYLDSVPAYMISRANDLYFPILTIPKNITFSEVLHTMMQILFSDTHTGWSDSDLKASYSFLEKNLIQDSCVISLDVPDQRVQVLLLEPVNYTRADIKSWHESLAQIRSFLQSNSSACLWTELPQHKHVFLTSHATDDCLSMLYALNIKFTLLSEQYGTNYYLGTEYVASSDSLYVWIDHAADALDTLRLIQARRGVCPYGSTKFIKVLGQLHRKDSSIVLDNQFLQQLLSYDKVNGTNYVQTLRIYLANSCNVTKTARQLFVHRHTLLKRLEKITEIGQVDLEDYYTRIYMSITLLFHDYFVY